MTDRELMQQALDALEKHVLEYETVEALRARLAQPKQERTLEEIATTHEVEWMKSFSRPQREWQGLTDEEIKEIVGPWGDQPVKGYTRKLFDQIEAKLKEKNNAI